jgi:hypothetical protein
MTSTNTSTHTLTPTYTFTHTFTPTWTSSATATASASLTPTETFTPTFTTTPIDVPCGQMDCSVAYPNPVFARGQRVMIDLLTSCPQQTHWAVYTSGYRKVYEESLLVDGPRTVVWDLRDDKGVPVAGGMYFIRVQSGNSETKVLKSLVLY